jgi:4-hydroxyphenylpyruvate dioxygenase
MPRTSIATVCLSGTLEDRLAAAGAAGFDAVEIFENTPVVGSRIFVEIAQRIDG